MTHLTILALGRKIRTEDGLATAVALVQQLVK